MTTDDLSSRPASPSARGGRRIALNRRTFFLGAGLTAAGLTLPSGFTAAAAAGNPFTLGVASGEPLPTAVVIWTRLAIDPLSTSSPGGMGTAAISVAWEVSTSESFASVVRSGTFSATAAGGYAVHVDVTGLSAGAEYFYRFHAATGGTTYTSAVGRTRTAPAVGTTPSSLTFLTASCARYDQGFYHAYQAMAADDPDLILFLGDYIYEYPTQSSPVRSLKGVPSIAGPDSRGSAYTDTLVEYRIRYAEQKTDAQLQMAHAAAPWVVVSDDHEVRNNWYAENTADTPYDRKAAAFRAWYENMPLRPAQSPNSSTIQMYRRIAWGSLARFDMLDTRQFRDKQSEAAVCSVIDSKSRTITGATQRQWLLDGFTDHTQKWNFIGQQVFFSPFQNSTNHCSINTDAWDGYRPERDVVANGWMTRGVRNPVVLTGDVHKHYAANVCVTGDLDSPIGTELITTSISSGGPKGSDPVINPTAANVLYGRNRRGYLRCTLTASQLRADFRTVDDVNKSNYADVTVATDRSFVVQDGARRLSTA